MADLSPVAGRKIFIGGVKARPDGGTVTSTTFTGVTWVEVKGWMTMGQVGDVSSVITAQLINESRDVKLKGTRNAGSMDNTFAWLPTDAGQIAMDAAGADDENYAFKIQMNDNIGSLTTPTKLEFLGLVVSQPYDGGGPNDVGQRRWQIEINTNVLVTAAS